MKRFVVLDTETTGLDPKLGHRIIEMAGVELVGRQITGRNFHRYVDPERDIDAGATEVHGMTREDLAGKPKFAEVAGEFLEFVRGAELVIHNASFDIGFLDAELALLGAEPIANSCAAVIDTLKLAREQFPGKRNNLDALCERLGVENSHRTLHGALLDARLLAEVWLAMTRGQETLVIDLGQSAAPALTGERRSRAPLRVLPATAEELAAHADALAAIDTESKGKCLWLALEATATPAG